MTSDSSSFSFAVGPPRFSPHHSLRGFSLIVHGLLGALARFAALVFSLRLASSFLISPLLTALVVGHASVGVVFRGLLLVRASSGPTTRGTTRFIISSARARPTGGLLARRSHSRSILSASARKIRAARSTLRAASLGCMGTEYLRGGNSLGISWCSE
jgi:hypothetical protein